MVADSRFICDGIMFKALFEKEMHRCRIVSLSSEGSCDVLYFTSFLDNARRPNVRLMNNVTILFYILIVPFRDRSSFLYLLRIQ